MSWFSSSASTVELDNKISEATSESIPNGDVELSVALEITDLIRSKKIPPQQCMRSLKKRLTLIYSNPNLLTSTLKLIDLCVKNSGYHFLVEISSKEFIDYLVDFVFKIHYNVNDLEVKHDAAKLSCGQFMLQLIQEWKLAFENQLQLNYVEKTYNSLKNQGYPFPSSEFQPNAKFVDSEVAPDWIDLDSCMICYNPFSLINRKHHCRSCGGVFCNDHSLSRIPLVALGIMEPVRVCDNCFAKHTKGKSGVSGANGANSVPSRSNTRRSMATNDNDDEDEELKKAIELSLQETSYSAPVQNVPQPQVSSDAPEEDDEMKAAIAASLQAFEEQQNSQKQYQKQFQELQPSQPESDFYNISIPSFPSQPEFGQSSNPWEQSRQQESTQQYNQQQEPPQQAPPAPLKPPVEDLTQQEEENINLFITLMTTIKQDRKKRSEILYDENLNNLHSKVVTLKPKVNRSLRMSIEKYEAFLELNNKISTVTKLYDEFLESKLNMAYRNHNISTPSHTGASNYFSTNEYNPMVDQQATGQRNSWNDHPVQQQHSGYNPTFSQQPTGQAPIRQEQPRRTSQYQEPTQPARRESQYEASNEPPLTSFNKQEEPDSTPYNVYYNQSQPGYPEDSDVQDDSDKEYLNNIAQTHSQSTYSQGNQSIPYPSHTNNEESDPANTSTIAAPTSANVRRQSSSIPAYALEEANAKYPALEQEDDEAGPNQSPSRTATTDFSNMDRFPLIPTNELEPMTTGGTSVKSKYEPEPLIEL